LTSLLLATCTYQEFRADMAGAPVRSTVGYPRFSLTYTLAGHARLIAPQRPMLNLPKDAFMLSYRRLLDRAGVDAIRQELINIVGAGNRAVLLCFDRLDRPTKDGGENWCHRTMFAAWWQEKTGEEVPELGATPSARPRVQLPQLVPESLFD